MQTDFDVQAVALNPADGSLLLAGFDNIARFSPGGGDALPELLAVTETNLLGSVSWLGQDSGSFFALHRNGERDHITRIAPGTGSDPPVVIGSRSFLANDRPSWAAVFDPITHRLILGTWIGPEDPARIEKVALDHVGQQGQPVGSRVELSEDGVIEDLRFFSHAATGNVRLSLYDNSEPKQLLWQSGAVANTAENAPLVVPISAGSPTELELEPGTYWLAWQVDSDAGTASFMPGTEDGSSFIREQSFGPAPSQLPAAELGVGSDRWTVWMTYASPTVSERLILVAGGGSYAGNSIAQQTRSLGDQVYRAARIRGLTGGQCHLPLRLRGRQPVLRRGPARHPGALQSAIQQAKEDRINRLHVVMLDHGVVTAPARKTASGGS